MNDNPIEIPETGLRFTVGAWRGKGDQTSARSFAGFVRKNRKILFPDIPAANTSDNQAHELAKEYLERFWSPDRMCTAIVTDVSMDEEKVYLVHPALKGAATVGYLADEGIPAFRCVIKDGFFLALGFEAGFYQDSGSEQVVLAGPVYTQLPPAPGDVLVKTRPPKPLTSEALNAISNLKSKRLFVSRKLEDQFAFLDWKMDLAKQRQVGCRYDDVEIDKSTQCLRFNVSASREQWQKIKKIRSFFASAVPLSASKNPDQWVSVVDNPRGLSLGELSVPRKQLNRMLSSQSSNEQLSCTLDIYPDTEVWDKCFNCIPEEGFLISEIHSDTIPVQRQITALRKLIKGEYANPYLPDFLFDATKARTPDAPVLGLDPADAEYLFNDLEAHELNDGQRMALAKLRASRDIALMQAGPGTGKTTVLGYFCALSVHSGERVLVASQAKVAVRKILESLPKDPRIRFLQIGRKEKEAESIFSEEMVVHTWLARVRDACNEQLIFEQEVVTDLEEADRIWPHFAEIVGEYKKLTKSRTAKEKQLRTIEVKLAKFTDNLIELKQRYSDYSSAVATVEQTISQLDNNSAVADLAEWVKSINPSERGDIFGSLKVWQEENRLPEIVQPLLADPPDNNKESSASTDSSGKSGFVGRLLQYFAPKQEQQPSGQKTEPNWSVEWINTNTLLKRLRDLLANLPRVLELCQEAERLCTIAAISEVGEAGWTELTKDLTNALKSSGKVVASVLEIDNIATALKPKKSFMTKLAETRALLQEVLANIPSIIDGLEKALTTVAEASANYLNSRLAETGKHIKKVQSSINSSKHRQKKTSESLTDINEQIKDLESVWAQTYKSLPPALRAQTGDDTPPICSKGLKMLDCGRQRYREDIKEVMDHHKVWGSIHKRWVNRLKQPTEADKGRLTPLYLEHCNVIGATCSRCGNWRDFLSRDECAQFDVTIVDEDSKATPPELLMPALLGRKLVLSGDYRQLPPTFKEGRCLERSYNELDEIGIDLEQVARFKSMVTASLFKKLYHDSPDVLKQLLVIEYRFPEQILEAVNQFNDPLLQCGLDSSDERFGHGLHIKTRSGEFLTPENHVLWLDTSRDSKGYSVRERQAGTSKVNDVEAQSVIKLIKLLNEAAGKAGMTPGSLGVGVITFYGAQVRLLGNLLSKLKPADKKFLNIRTNTVDDFQGEERDIIVLSMVRAKQGRIGKFVKQYERVHVAMSRAKKLLVIVGSADTFREVEVPVLAADGKTIGRRCYANILGIVKKYGGIRNVRDLL